MAPCVLCPSDISLHALYATSSIAYLAIFNHAANILFQSLFTAHGPYLIIFPSGTIK